MSESQSPGLKRCVRCGLVLDQPSADLLIGELHYCVQCSVARAAAKKTAAREPGVYDRPIQHHGGAKYLRKIRPADGKGEPILVDVYCVIKAFSVTDAGLQHALKKILAPGQRGKGDKLKDIEGAMDALWRAREQVLEDQET